MNDPKEKSGAGSRSQQRLEEALRRAAQSVERTNPPEPASDAEDTEEVEKAPDPRELPSHVGGMDYGSIELSAAEESMDLAEQPPPHPRRTEPAAPLGAEAPAKMPPPTAASDAVAVGDVIPPGERPEPGRAQCAKSTAQASAAPQPMAPSVADQPRARSHRPPAGRSVRVSRASAARASPRRGVKITLILVVVLGLVAAGVFAWLTWRDSRDAEREAQMNALDQSSLDSLKREAAKRKQLGS